MKGNTIILLYLVILSSCSSLYRGQMVRVRSSASEVAARQVGNSTKAANEKAKVVSQELHGEELSNHIISPEGSLSRNGSGSAVQDIKNSSRNPNKLLLASEDLSDLESRIEPADTAFLKDRYRSANRMAVWSLVSLLSVPVTFVLGIIAALILALSAVRIYRRYKNPGVEEKYILAMSMLVLSVLSILLIIGALAVLSGVLLL